MDLGDVGRNDQLAAEAAENSKPIAKIVYGYYLALLDLGCDTDSAMAFTISYQEIVASILWSKRE